MLYDEIDLAPGKIRVKQGGGHGGHNGLRSIDAHIGKDFWRVRIGIGHPGDKDRVHGHVLRDFAKADERLAREAARRRSPECGARSPRTTTARFMSSVSRAAEAARRRAEKRAAAEETAQAPIAGTSEPWVSTAASSACPTSASRRCSTR